MNTRDPDLVVRAMARMYLKIDGQHQTLTGQLRTIAKQEKEIARLKAAVEDRSTTEAVDAWKSDLNKENADLRQEQERLRQECRLKDKQIEDLKRRLGLRPDEVSLDIENSKLRTEVNRLRAAPGVSQSHHQTIKQLLADERSRVDGLSKELSDVREAARKDRVELAALRGKIHRISNLPYMESMADNVLHTIHRILQEDES